MGRLMLVALVLACLGSAFAVVYSTHEARKLFAELQNQEKTRDDLDVEWGRLQLEQSTFATHSQIEATARDKLGMRMPRPDAVILVRP